MLRIEPTPRATGIEDGLAARVHDPLWLLARQWQLGEFAAQDAGSPTLVRVRGTTSPITHWRPGTGGPWRTYDTSGVPLEALIEAEPPQSAEARLRVEGGAHFLRLLAGAGLGELGPAAAAAHPFLPGSTATLADRLLAAVAARTPDAEALASALVRGAAAFDAGPSAAAVARVAEDWLAWWRAETTRPSGSGSDAAFDPHRMEHTFSLAGPAAGGTVLTAAEYLADGLDWAQFDVAPRADAGPARDGLGTRPLTASAIPAPVRFGGMPASRFWEMEDARYDFGSIDAAPGDLGRLLLAEFATVYGNDWYALPLVVGTGTLTVLDEVVVTDVFGREYLLPRAGENDAGWNLFTLSTTDGADHPATRGLLQVPGAPAVLEGEPLEDVRLVRDEMANMGFAVERVWADPAGTPVDRRAAWLADWTPEPPTRPGLPPRYLVETEVPDYWVPLLPERLPNGTQRLRLVPMAGDTTGQPLPVHPKGRLLAGVGGEPLWLHDEEVPSEGARVTRTWRYARWLNGSIHLWVARTKHMGQGEASSGLRFDTLR